MDEIVPSKRPYLFANQPLTFLTKPWVVTVSPLAFDKRLQAAMQQGCCTRCIEEKRLYGLTSQVGVCLYAAPDEQVVRSVAGNDRRRQKHDE